MAERPFGQAEDRQENAMLRGRKKADAAVIGGGFTGLHTALLLARAGLRVTLLEADTLGGGASARCAGTVGLLGRALLCDTEKSYGKEATARYVEAQQAAFQTLRDLLPKCDPGVRFRERDLYLTAENEREKKRLEQEHRAMQRAGLNAELTQATQCPRPNVLSIRIQGQGTLEPPAYLRSLERLCAEKGVQLYEHSRVIAAESNLVYTQKGSVLAPYLIIATGFPVINVPGWYFLRLWQSQGYVLPLCGATPFEGVYRGQDGRYGAYATRDGAVLTLLGKRAGVSEDIRARYLRDEQGYFQVQPPRPISGADVFTPDGLPYVGAYSSRTPNLFVATGYAQFGVLKSLAAAQAISAKILGLADSNDQLLSPRRKAARLFWGDTGLTLSQAGRYIGGLVRLRAPTCPHMGCKMVYQPKNHCWVCPCHGSRFDSIGRLRNGPAVRDAHIRHRPIR